MFGITCNTFVNIGTTCVHQESSSLRSDVLSVSLGLYLISLTLEKILEKILESCDSQEDSRESHEGSVSSGSWGKPHSWKELF